MSALATTRLALFELLASVPGIGRVHDRERYVRDEAKFRQLYLARFNGADQLRGWWFRRSATAEVTLGVGRRMEVHTWQIRGYMALNDDEGSELAFDELIEGLRDAVRTTADDHGSDVPWQPAPFDSPTDGLQVLDSGPVLFCGVLCHSALLELKTWNYL